MNSYRIPLLIVATVLLTGLVACTHQGSTVPAADTAVMQPHQDMFNGEFPTIFHIAKGLAVQLRTNMRGGSLSEHPCVVTTFADIDNLEVSSRFGRLMAEALGAELFTQGGTVRDVRTSGAIMLEPRQGEFNLTRSAAQAAETVDANSIVVGTYATGRHSVAVTVRMIDIANRDVLSVAVTELVRTEAVDSLLTTTQSTAGQEQAPVPTVYDTI